MKYKIFIGMMLLLFVLLSSLSLADINQELSKCSAYSNESEKTLFNKKAAELISKGADVNVRNENGTPILGNAAYSGNHELLKLLITNKADINIRDRNTGRTPLFLAIGNTYNSNYKQQSQVITYLIANGADVNIPDNYGASCLMVASYLDNKSLDMMQLLISHGADVNAKDNEGNSILSTAIKNGDIKKVKYLVSKGAKFDNTKPILAYAVNSMNYDLVKYLIMQRQKGHWIDMDACDENGNTPGMLADQYREEYEYILNNWQLDKKTGEISGTSKDGVSGSAKLSEIKMSYNNILKIQDIIDKNGGVRLKKKTEMN